MYTVDTLSGNSLKKFTVCFYSESFVCETCENKQK